jgi:class 3 adenylate cyclase
MPERQNVDTVRSPVRVELEVYSPEIQLSTLSIGIDNIHYDVYLSPRFCDFTRKYVLDLTRVHAGLAKFYGSDAKAVRQPETGAFRKMLADFLQAGLTHAKFKKNIEWDILLRLAVMKFITQEIPAQFASVLLECKDWIRARGEFFERSEKAHVLKAQLAELQSDRKRVVRKVGQQIFQILSEIEESSLARMRRALFGEEFAETYDVLNNRLVFVEGFRDDALFLEQYVLLGNFQRDPDRYEQIDALFTGLIRDAVLTGERNEELRSAQQRREQLSAQALELRSELIRLEQHRTELIRQVEAGEGLLSKMLGRRDPADARVELEDLEKRHARLQRQLDDVGQKLESAKAQTQALEEEYQNRMGSYLNCPENANRLFNPNWSGSGTEAAGTRAQLLEELTRLLEQQDLLWHILASYELRNIHVDYCPPLHLQQLKRALVVREEQKLVEDILRQFPARRFSMEKILERARAIRRYPPEQIRTVVLRFAEDFMRMRRDLRNAQRLSALMERINLIRAEKTRDLSRLNNSLHEYALPDEERQDEDKILSHAIIKADVRGSTQITQDLLARGLNPASHFSLNFFEPVRKILEQYGAFKVFVEGDAIILGIYENESNKASQRAVAKACLLARDMLEIAQSYNQRAEANQLPRLELGLGIAYQDSAPTFWEDGDSKIMISRAINLSDRLSGCSKVARRLFGQKEIPFNVFLLQTIMEGTNEEEVQEFLVRYNLNGIELNALGFQKLQEEISLTTREIDCPMPWSNERQTLYMGEVPIGERLEKLVIRKGRVRQLMPGGVVGQPGSHEYFEVCVGPRFRQFLEGALANGANR